MEIAIFGYPGESYRQLCKKTTLESVTQKGLIRKNYVQKISSKKK